MSLQEWFLTAEERGNPDTSLDRRHPDGCAWTKGNEVRVLVHGAEYFRELLARVREMSSGDLLLFTDWRGDPDERLDGPGSEVGKVFADAAHRGVDVRGLVWRSHLDRFQFSEQENRHLAEEIEAAGGECLMDMRVRPGGSHHQKLVVLRHPSRPASDIAFIGGIDLCHSRRDDAEHAGDPQSQPMSAPYGDRPPWHDAQVAIQGPAVGDAETVFRERWNDPAPVSRNPLYVFGDEMHRDDRHPNQLPPQLPDPLPAGKHATQLLRTYPVRRPGYPFAKRGERSIERAYRKVWGKAESLVYLEDQYLWSTQVADVFAAALRRSPRLRLIVVIPRFPDQLGRVATPGNLVGRELAMERLLDAGGDRVGIYSIENRQGVPIYVHAKVCVVDDVWATVGSDNANRRSWTHDSELSCAVLDPTSETSFARNLRMQLAREHLGRPGGENDDLLDHKGMFDAFARSAAQLDAWHRSGKLGTRPPGQLRKYWHAPLTRWQRMWSRPLYQAFFDPDGRTPLMKYRKEV
ncbi:MAG TPA: phospholipase D family protein [Actinomycetes bacterium]|nr:phospholipase D family protein [Actinomycetes bacterium]